MRIGLVSGNITSPGSGRSIVVPLAKALRNGGHTVFLVDVTPTFSKQIVDSELLVVQAGLLSSLIRHPSLGVNYLKNTEFRLPWITAHALNDVIQRLSLDVVYVFSNFNVLPILMKAPLNNRIVLINLIGFGISPRRGGADDTFWIQSEIMSRPLWDIHVCATNFEYMAYRAVYEQLRIDPKKLKMLPHSYDSEFFFPETKFISNDVKQLTYPVAVYPRKNIEMLLEVAARLGEKMPIHVTVTGPIIDKSYYSYLLNLCGTLGLTDRVSFLDGRLTTPQLGQLLRKTDLVFYPSFQETFGIGIIETLACGVPVLLPKDIPALNQFLGLDGVWFTERSTETSVETATKILETSGSDHRTLIARGVHDEYSNVEVARRILLTVKEAFEIRKLRETLNWEALYGNTSYDQMMFSKKGGEHH